MKKQSEGMSAAMAENSSLYFPTSSTRILVVAVRAVLHEMVSSRILEKYLYQSQRAFWNFQYVHGESQKDDFLGDIILEVLFQLELSWSAP